MRRIMHRWGKRRWRKGKKSECHAPRTASSFYSLHANSVKHTGRACVLCVRINLNANERDEKESREARGRGKANDRGGGELGKKGKEWGGREKRKALSSCFQAASIPEEIKINRGRLGFDRRNRQLPINRLTVSLLPPTVSQTAARILSFNWEDSSSD